MDTSITRAAFCQEVQRVVAGLAEEVWTQVVEGETITHADAWLRDAGGGVLRAIFGRALSSRAERRGVDGRCGCGGAVGFRQRRPFRVHTVLPGRDVDARLVYGQCATCRRGRWPVLEDLAVDAEGFTPGLQELSLLAGVLEPYETASAELLQRFAGVDVSAEKIQALVRQDGARAQTYLQAVPGALVAPPPGDAPPVYVEMDGGMVFVERRWQEVKVGCVFREEDRTETGVRGALTARQVVAVRGTPDDLGRILWPVVARAGGADRRAVVIGDGAPWIWRLAAELCPQRVEILDWYHVDEHVSEVARILYRDGTPKAQAWRHAQLDRLWTDGVDQVLEGLRFLAAHQRSRTKHETVDALQRYLTTNRDRVRYRTFREAGYHIGSGAVESAVHHVVQHRMKRPGMRWRAAGADAMLALRSVYRSMGAWDDFWAQHRPAAA